MFRYLRKTRKLILTVCFFLAFMIGLAFSVSAEDIKVEIVSFATGQSGELRSSQLLHARVTGYDGDITQLKYTWENDLRTYLYIYNTSNMYNVKGTISEIEIPYNDNSGSNDINPIDYGNGYAWAAVFGDDLKNNSLWGYIKVVVSTPDGTVLCEATHQNTGGKNGFATPSVSADLTAVNYGLFEGEAIDMKALISRSSIVHADCVSSTVANAAITSGNDKAALSLNSDGSYTILGLSQGIANISFTLNKDICKFHSESSATVDGSVFVFKKPQISTTLDTLTISNLDDNCEYFVGGMKGVVDSETNTITYTNLNPGTNYEVMVRGNYGDKYAYAYVAESTKTTHKATVKFYVNEALSDVVSELETQQNLYLSNKLDETYIPLVRESVGVFSATVNNGAYYVYYKHSEDDFERIGDHQVTVFNADSELNLHYFKVEYYVDGELYEKTLHYEDSTAYVTENIPEKEDYIFLHWVDEAGTTYHHGQLITSAIDEPIRLDAQWSQTKKVKVNVKINHGKNPTPNNNVAFTLIAHEDHEELYHKSLSETNFDGYSISEEGAITTYIAEAVTFDDIADIEYNLSVEKNDYAVNVTTETDGDVIVYNVDLEYDGEIHTYSITLDANGGSINGGATYTIADHTEIPSLQGFVPEREHGYLFSGWFMDREGTVPVTAGASLSEDITIYASWLEPLSVSGTFAVDGFYYEDGEKIKILDANRPKQVEVVLQMSHNEEHNDVDSIEADLVYDELTDVATVNYSFDHLHQPIHSGHTYSVKAYLINYTATYDNNADGVFASDENLFIFDEGKSAVVNGKLSFTPETYIQKFKIDATLIGEGFRPETAIAQVLFQSPNATAPDTAISQHTVPPYGEEVTFGDVGIANGNINLWRSNMDGTDIMYQLLVTNTDGEDYSVNSHFFRRYEAPSHSGEQNPLTAILYPKTYRVTLDLGLNEGESVSNMDDYLALDGQSYFAVHTWSYDTVINALPKREGYQFLGWRAEEDSIYEDGKVLASVGKNVTLEAIWSEINWTTDTDSGYIEGENGKEAIIRFLFDIEVAPDMKDKITRTGIRFISGASIGEDIEGITFVGDALSGTKTTFYADILAVTEDKADVNYYAIGFAEIDGKTYWSPLVKAKANFAKEIKYE